MWWSISMRYLLAHKRQSLISVAGVTIGVMMFIAMFAMMLGFRTKFIVETVESSGHLVVNDEPREAQTPILEQAYRDPNALLLLRGPKPRDQIRKIKNPQGLTAKIRAMPGVLAVAPEVDGEAIATYGNRNYNVAIIGIDPAQQLRVTTIGEKLLDGDFDRLRGTANGAVIGSGVASLLGARVGDTISLTSPTGGQALARVVGVFQTGVTPVDYSRIYMMINDAQTLLDRKNIINNLVVRVDDYLEAPAYAAQIEAVSGYKTESWQESNANFLKIFAIQDAITWIITGALLVVAAFGVLNILIMAVLERVNDIAILKSFGYSRRDITLIFMNQGLVIGLAGSISGIACGRMAVVLLRRLPVRMEGLVTAEGLLMADSLQQYVWAFVFSIVVVLIASVYPARRAASYDPVDVIRGAH